MGGGLSPVLLSSESHGQPSEKTSPSGGLAVRPPLDEALVTVVRSKAAQGEPACGSSCAAALIVEPAAASLVRTTISGTPQAEKPVKKACPQTKGLFRNTVTGAVKPMPCNQWDCPVCGPIKKARVADRVGNGLQDHSFAIKGFRVRMVTLTQKRGSKRSITADWATFRHLLIRSGVRGLRYFWTKEFTPTGHQRHLHVLINAYIPHILIKKLWRQATRGESYIVHITGRKQQDESGDITNPAGYATKYLTKAYGKEDGFESHERRYGFSQHGVFSPLPPAYLQYITPIEALERACLGSPWAADISQRAIVLSWGLSPPQEKKL